MVIFKYVTPFCLAALIGQIWLWQRLLGADLSLIMLNQIDTFTKVLDKYQVVKKSIYILVDMCNFTSLGCFDSWDIFWINSNNGTFIALQMKSFGSKNFKLHAGVKKCHFDNLSDRAGMTGLVSTTLKNPLLDFKNYFCFGFLWIPSNVGRQI